MHLVVHFAWKKLLAMWLCTDLQLQPMVWLGGQGLRKTMIRKLVTKKFGKRKMERPSSKLGDSVKTLCLVECSPNGDISREGF